MLKNTDNIVEIVKLYENVHIEQQIKPISNLPEMFLGSSAIDGGNLILSAEEKDRIVSSYPEANKIIKNYIGSEDLLDGVRRYCIWIEDDQIELAKNIPAINERINKCRLFRENAGRDAKKAASVPHRFLYRKYKDKEAIALPATSSERREYLPVGVCDKGAVASNDVLVVYDSNITLFGILSSKMHTVWALWMSRKLESQIRYSINLTYNNFPFPEIFPSQKQVIDQNVLDVIMERERYSERTLSQLYDPDKMPAGLREAHHNLDLAVERCYRLKPFVSDEERLEYLFKLYEEMTAKKQVEKNNCN